MGELTPSNLTQTGRREITHLLRSHNLSPSAIYVPLRRGLDIAENLEPRLAHIRDTMALAFDLGPRLVVVPIGSVPEKEDDPARGLLKESLTDLGRHGDRTGVSVALDGADNPATLAAFLDRLDVGSLGVNFNPGQLVIAGQNPHDAIKTLNRRLIYAQAQDARRISPSRMGAVPLGHGDLDWIQILGDFEIIGYRGFLTVLADNQAEAASGIAFLRRFLAPG